MDVSLGLKSQKAENPKQEAEPEEKVSRVNVITKEVQNDLINQRDQTEEKEKINHSLLSYLL